MKVTVKEHLENQLEDIRLYRLRKIDEDILQVLSTAEDNAKFLLSMEEPPLEMMRKNASALACLVSVGFKPLEPFLFERAKNDANIVATRIALLATSIEPEQKEEIKEEPVAAVVVEAQPEKAAPPKPQLTEENVKAFADELVKNLKTKSSVRDTRKDDLLALTEILKRFNHISVDTSGFDLSNLDLSHMDLQGFDFTGANVTGTSFEGANLSGANFSHVKFPKDISFYGANLRGAKFTSANLQEVDLQGKDLEGADFSHANLQETNLSGSNLKQSNLEGTDLSQSHLVGTNFEGATVTKANFASADIKGANLAETRKPHVKEAVKDATTLLPRNWFQRIIDRITGKHTLRKEKLAEFKEKHPAALKAAEAETKQTFETLEKVQAELQQVEAAKATAQEALRAAEKELRTAKHEEEKEQSKPARKASVRQMLRAPERLKKLEGELTGAKDEIKQIQKRTESVQKELEQVKQKQKELEKQKAEAQKKEAEKAAEAKQSKTQRLKATFSSKKEEKKEKPERQERRKEENKQLRNQLDGLPPKTRGTIREGLHKAANKLKGKVTDEEVKPSQKDNLSHKKGKSHKPELE